MCKQHLDIKAGIKYLVYYWVIKSVIMHFILEADHMCFVNQILICSNT